MSQDNEQVQIELRQQQDYRFEIEFGGDIAPLTADEPPPLGAGRGPSPVQLLCASVGNCLSDSLLFALRKYKYAPEPMRCTVTADVGRNAEGRLRVLRITGQLHLGIPATGLPHLQRALDQFESFCTVTQSVGQGIAIHVEVFDSEGQRLKG